MGDIEAPTVAKVAGAHLLHRTQTGNRGSPDGREVLLDAVGAPEVRVDGRPVAAGYLPSGGLVLTAGQVVRTWAGGDS